MLLKHILQRKPIWVAPKWRDFASAYVLEVQWKIKKNHFYQNQFDFLFGRCSSILICWCCCFRGLVIVLVAIEKGHLMKTIKHEWCFWIVVLCKSKWHGRYESVNESQITNKNNKNNSNTITVYRKPKYPINSDQQVSTTIQLIIK